MKLFEEQFRNGLRLYLTDNLIKHSALAKKAEIGADVFSRLLNGNRCIFVDEAAKICFSLGVTIDFIMQYGNDEQTAVREVS